MKRVVRVYNHWSKIQSNIYKSGPKPSQNHIYTLTNNLLHKNTIHNGHSQTLLSDTVSRNKLISWHVKNGRLNQAQKVFDEMPQRDSVSWNTMLSGFRNAKKPHIVYQFFIRMLRSGLNPNEHTISVAIVAVLGSETNVLVSQFHCHAVQSGLANCLFVGSALIKGYADTSDPTAMKKAFDDVVQKDVSTWNALISGYARLGMASGAQWGFDAMPERNDVSWTSLVNAYIAAEQIKNARRVFDAMLCQNVVTWTAMIGGYVRNREFFEAFELFAEMRARPNHFTLSTVLTACAGIGSLIAGHQVHSMVVKLMGSENEDEVLSASLVDMYAKCGDVGSAAKAFDVVKKKNVVTWNAMIGGYARHGMGDRALEGLKRMVRSGVGPDHVTLVNLLTGCAQCGLVRQAEDVFYSMEERYGVRPVMEHYGCLVDVYARAGSVEKATKLVREMPFKPDVVVLGALVLASQTSNTFYSRSDMSSLIGKGNQVIQ